MKWGQTLPIAIGCVVGTCAWAHGTPHPPHLNCEMTRIPLACHSGTLNFPAREAVFSRSHPALSPSIIRSGLADANPFNHLVAGTIDVAYESPFAGTVTRPHGKASCSNQSLKPCRIQNVWTRPDPVDNPPFLVHSPKQARHLVEWTVALTPLFALGASYVIDHRLALDNTGIWARSNSLDLEHAVMAVEGVGALWLGGHSRIGRTFWQAVDSSVFTAITTQALKYVISRERPIQSPNPHDFFQGRCCESFPSGEVALQASFVTPFIAEYYQRDPWIWALEALPLYDAEARMKEQGHWQTDVISGFAIGTAWGIYAHEEKQPFILSVLPGGFMIGLHESF